MAVNHSDGGSIPPRNEWDCGRMVNAADCNPCLGNGGSSPLNPKERSIMVNAFDLGSKDCGFKSCRSDC